MEKIDKTSDAYINMVDEDNTDAYEMVIIKIIVDKINEIVDKLNEE